MDATKRGRELHVKPDAAMEQRLLWIDCVLASGLGLPPAMRRPSAVLRRAVECYVQHLESLLRREGDPATADLRAAFEPSSVRRCADGADLRLAPEQLTALPVRPLSDIAADVRAAQPKVIDQIRAELRRNRPAPSTNGDTSE